MVDKLITRKEAKVLELKTYFTGKECKYGHVSRRQVCSGQCIECKVIRTRVWREKPLEDKFKSVKVAKDSPSKEELCSIFDYDSLTGFLYWKPRDKRVTETDRSYRAWKTRWEGQRAGSKHYANGYIEVRTTPRGKLYKAHRLVWVIMTGEDPSLPIDHVNNTPWDNRWCNLRLATNQENARNSVSFSSTEYKGVSYVESRNTYTAQYCIEDCNYFERGFITAKDAAIWYDTQVKEVYGEFAKLNFPENIKEKINE